MNFGLNFDVGHVIISLPSTGSSTAGRTDYSLTCSATLIDPSINLPSGVPTPNFQWFFGGNTSLPSGVAALPNVMSSTNASSITYTSILQFSSPLSQSVHMGSYTCRLGPGRLVSSATMVTVNGMIIIVITPRTCTRVK